MSSIFPNPLATLLVKNPSLADVLDVFKRQLLIDFNCHAVGTIEVFNPLDQTAIIKLNYNKTVYQIDGSGNFVSTTLEYPLLQNVPVVVLNGGVVSLTFPIATGDQALVFFNDRDLDNWYLGATSGQVNSGRLHNMSDGLAIVGLHPLSGIIPAYDTTRGVLRGGAAAVGVNPIEDKVLITNTYPANALTLGTVLGQFETATSNLNTAVTALNVALTALTTIMGTTPPSTAWEIAVAPVAVTTTAALAVVASELAAVAAQLVIVSAELGELLE
jgi:hypothetical protein